MTSRGGEEPNAAERLQSCGHILNAGDATTTILIGNALMAFTEDPKVKADLLSKQELFIHESVGLGAYLYPVIDKFFRFESLKL